MKKIVTNGFFLAPEIKTVDFSGFNEFDIKKLYTIVDVKRNQVIYSLGTKGLGYISYDSNLKRLVLQYNTSNISVADPITVLYEVDGKFDIENAIPAVMAPGEILNITGYDTFEEALIVKPKGNIRVDGYETSSNAIRIKSVEPIEVLGYNSTNNAVRNELIGNVTLTGYEGSSNAIRVRQVENVTLKGYDAVNDVIKIKSISNTRIDGYDAVDDAVKIKTLSPLSIKTNEVDNFREEFSGTNIDSSVWTSTIDAADFTYLGGNTDGSSYLSIIKSIRTTNTVTELFSKPFSLPTRLMNGVSFSYRQNGTWFGIDYVAVDSSTGIPIRTSEPTEVGITSISITSNIWTVTCSEEILGKMKTNNVVVIYGAHLSTLNVGPVTITLSDRNSFQFTWTTANGSHTTAAGSLGPSAAVQLIDVLDRATSGVGVAYEGVGTGAARFTTRDDSATYTALRTDAGLANIGAATQVTAFQNKPYTYSFKPNRLVETTISSRTVKWDVVADESQAISAFTFKKHLPLPDLKRKYAIRFIAKNLKNQPYVYKGTISSIARTAAQTVVTVTTASAHGLVVGNVVAYAGFTNVDFPTATVTVATVTSPTVFTFNLGTAAATTSTGLIGNLFLLNGAGNTNPIVGLTFSNYRVTNNLITLTSTATTTLVVGVHYYIFTNNVDIDTGLWRCVSISGTVSVLEPLNKTVPNTALVNQNITVVVAPECRIHLSQAQTYDRSIVEIAGAWNNTRDADEALAVNVTNNPNVGTITTVSTLTSITNPISVNCFSANTAYTTQIPASSNVVAFSQDLGATIVRNKVNTTLYSNVAATIQIEHSLDNVVWFTVEASTTATTIAFPTFNYTAVTPITPPTVTMTNANPCVVTYTAHPFQTGAPVVFATTGALPTGIVAGTVYYVRVINVNTFNLYDTLTNAITTTATTGIRNSSGTQSGVHTITNLSTLTIPNTHTLFAGQTATVTTSGTVQIIGVAATTVNIAFPVAPAATGTVTVPANTVFRASQIALPIVGRFVRVRITNPTTNPTTIMYATFSSLQN